MALAMAPVKSTCSRSCSKIRSGEEEAPRWCAQPHLTGLLPDPSFGTRPGKNSCSVLNHSDASSRLPPSDPLPHRTICSMPGSVAGLAGLAPPLWVRVGESVDAAVLARKPNEPSSLLEIERTWFMAATKRT
jgi:hypothetical protein